MRLGVLDIGSNTVHLLVADVYPGGRPLGRTSQRTVLRLMRYLGPDGEITEEGVQAMEAAVSEARKIAAAEDVEELLATATSAVREAANGKEVIARIQAALGQELQVLGGESEARYTFLAVRRWFGWAAGQILLLDIGGGSLEIAGGSDEEPSLAVSLPLGAGRLYREWLVTRAGLAPDATPGADVIADLHAHVAAQLKDVAVHIAAAGPFERIVGTSKTFRTVARLAGAAPSDQGPLVPRVIGRTALRQVLSFISRMTPADVGQLEGVAADRSEQLVAGAVVALAAMEVAGADSVDICPWALREGVILQRLDQLTFGP